jgi:hypothetical protein
MTQLQQTSLDNPDEENCNITGALEVQKRGTLRALMELYR